MLLENMKELAKTNGAQERCAGFIEELRAALEQTEEYKILKSVEGDLAEINKRIATLRQEINQETLEIYQTTGEKKPLNGVGIRVGQAYNYDQQAAKDYCLAELPEALKLDTKTFEKYVKGVQEVKPLEFVTVEEKVTPTIASDLSEYLEDK